MRTTFGRLALTASLVMLAAGDASAQRTRVTIVPFVGYGWFSPIHDHETLQQDASGVRFGTQQRLAVTNALLYGGRIEYGVTGGFSLYAEGAFGSSRLNWRDWSWSRSDDELLGESYYERQDDASIATFGFGVGRRFALGTTLPEVDVRLGGTVERFTLTKLNGQCPPPSGGIPVCDPNDPWDHQYTVPGFSAALSVRRPVASRVMLDVSAGFAAGRANTSNFWVDLIPSQDAYEAPKSNWVRATRAQAGLSFRL